jgi:hypothetical protein
MYYLAIAVGDENHLEYYCRNCGHTDYTIAQEGACIIDTNNKKKEHLFNHIVNKYTKYDPTLPRIYTLKCPNESCKTNDGSNDKPAEIIYMRYDDNNLKYLYICYTCDTVWRGGN